MKNKKISRLVASMLTATVALNFCSGNIINISAHTSINSSNLEESSSSSDDLSKLSGVGIEQMQEDFDSITDNSNADNSDEEIVPDGTVVDDSNISSSLDKSSSIKPKANNFATFSFDGENAGKIIIIDKNISPDAEIRYSLDGGNSWTKTTSHEIQLSKEEINSITAEKDIIVGLASIESNKETIDIKIGAAPTTSDLYKNDVENKFFGRLNGLQVSTDGGTTWEDYNNSKKFDGRVVVKVRYKPTGTYLTSAVSQFTFTEDTVSKTRTYIPITSITSHSACSEQDGNTYSSAHLVDGNGNTTWTSLTKDDGELYYSVGFSDIKFITEIEYMPSDLQKGRLKSGEIYTSFNDKDWKLVQEFRDLANNKDLKSIKLNSPVSAKYVKIVATETYEDGSRPGTSNTYFSGKLLNFYEDSTLEYSDEPFIKYSTQEQTTNSVTATLYLPEGFDAKVTSYKFLENGYYDFVYTDNNSQTHTIRATVNNIVRGDLSKGVYLSDLDYLNSSTVGYGNITKDKNPSGGTISLIVDGSTMNFGKGLGAHATSSLIYDIEAFSNKYTKFSTYVGVDSSRGTNGSVKFTISASNDGKEWTTLKTTGVLTGNSDAVHIEVDVTGYAYLKLYADQNGDNASDHSVYADARLVKSDYNISGEYYTGFKTLSQYDALISSRSVDENYRNHKKEVLEREFVNRVGYANILAASRDCIGVSEALAWLQSDQEALQLFIEAGGYFSGTGYNALVALGKLYNEYEADMGNINYKKMLLGTATAYSKDIKTFLVNYGGNCISANPVETYKNFKTLYNSGQFVRKSEFENYSMELVRAVMDSRINYDEMFWLRDYIEKKYPSATHINNWVRYNGYGYAKYVNTGYGKAEFYDESKKTDWDKKYDFLKYNVSYGEKNLYRIWMFMEAGAICWGLSGLGMVVNEVQGIPAIGTFQPGHEAYLLYSQNSEGKGIWKISDDIAGWGSSYSRWGSTIQTEHRLMLGWGQMDYNKLNGGNNTSYTLLAQDALNDYSNYLNSMFYNLIANSYEKNTIKHEEALNNSLGCYSKNLDSMYGLYKSYLVDESTTDKEWVELARKVATEYRYFPAPMVDLLKLIKAQVEDTILQIEVDMLQTDSLKKASIATSSESLQNSACQQVAKSLLGENSKELASFSFDGDNANTILINESYANSTIQVRVSLDGGDTWEEFENGQTFTTSHSIKLTDEQVSKINATDDILVGLMGVTENFTIDIKDGNSLGSDIYLNDDENLLIGGNTSNLEYSLDDGQTWKDYVSGLNSDTRIEGDTKALFRYKAYGVYLQGPSREYTFTANNYDPYDKYIQLKNVSLYKYSSEQNNTDKAAANLFDGNYNTRWHTTWDWSDNEKYISVEFDKVRYISKLSYLSYDSSGRLKSGNVYTSLDGENWTKVYTYSDLPNTTGWKDIDLGDSYPAKYIKIDSTESHWLHSGQENLYASGRMLNFYEDTTKTYVADVSIDYSTTSSTSDNVTATLVLPEGCEVIGESEYVFENNGTFEFKYTDANGVEHSIEAKVTWIDKEGPEVNIEYSTTELTNEDVVATLIGLSEGDIVVNNDGSTSYTFKENGTFEFIVRDKLGNETKVSATVSCIDKTSPTADVVYSTEELTNESVVVKLENFSEEGVVIVNNDGKAEYIFEENGTFEFIIRDKAGNETIIPVVVNWIDKGGPVVNVSYSTKELTNKDVVVTLEGLEEGDTVVNNDGNTTYTFKENGTFEFIVRDKIGNETRVPVVVTWIDKVAPTASVEYNMDSWTNEDVIAKLVDLSEEVTILNSEVVNNSYTFKDNGEFKFEFVDKAGNKGEVVAKVNWIDKTKAEKVITFSEKAETEDAVTVTLNINTDEVEILNNNGLTTFTFTENGVFTFKLRLRSTGYEFEMPINVDWIKENPEVGDEEDNDSNGGSIEDSDKEDNNSNGGNTEDSDKEDNNFDGVNNNQSIGSNSVNSGTINSNGSSGTGTSSKNEEESNISGDSNNSSNSVEEDIVSNEDTTSETTDDEEVSDKEENKSESNSNANKNSASNDNESKKSWVYVLGTSLGASLLGAFLWLKKSYFILRKKIK